MTAPHVLPTKLPINPPDKTGLREWLEVRDVDSSRVRVRHVRRVFGLLAFSESVTMAVRDWCGYQDYFAMTYWKHEQAMHEEDEDGNEGNTGISAPKEEAARTSPHRERTSEAGDRDESQTKEKEEEEIPQANDS